MKLLHALERDVLLGDGANGTLLAEWGFNTHHYDFANILAPDLVKRAHFAYFDAGAEFVETNTFQANKVRLSGTNVDLEAINIEGAKLAREAAGHDRLVLGAIGPSGKPIEPIGHVTLEEIYESIAEQATWLEEGGVDGFILETYIELDELETAIRAVQSVSRLPIIACKAFIEDGEALAEGIPSQAAKRIAELGVAAVGANCIVGPQRMIDIVRQMSEATSLPILSFPTPGLPQLVRGQIVYDIHPDYFAKASIRLAEDGARILGGCCGTTPDHIRFLREAIDAKPIKRATRASVVSQASERKIETVSEPTELSQKLGKKFIVTVEMDLPRGLNVDKLLKGCRALKIKGADLIDISDGARARLRMNPLAISTLIQNQVGIEVMMHFSCRDRNLLAVQADLLGAHALGVRNILAITGDPANIGDYPSATSVFDVDSIGLTRIMSRFNEGVDLAGYSVGQKCAFTIAGAFDPLARDMPYELDRLKRKADAGAHVIYTQPIFEPKSIDLAVEVCIQLGLPVFIGVLPLRSSRHAEFMHNEVPGIEVPDWLRQGMAAQPDDESMVQFGICEAQKLAAKLKTHAQGLYLMPPFGSPQIAEAVMDAVL